MSDAGPKPSPPIPRSIWMPGFVSLFMDVSSELIHGLQPVFMVSRFLLDPGAHVDVAWTGQER
jgi:hypothetical protein